MKCCLLRMQECLMAADCYYRQLPSDTRGVQCFTNFLLDFSDAVLPTFTVLRFTLLISDIFHFATVRQKQLRHSLHCLAYIFCLLILVPAPFACLSWDTDTKWQSWATNMAYACTLLPPVLCLLHFQGMVHTGINSMHSTCLCCSTTQLVEDS